MLYNNRPITLRKPVALNIPELLKDPAAQDIQGLSADKISWVCHSIYDGMKKFKNNPSNPKRRKLPNFYPLYSVTLREYLGREYAKIMELMETHGIINCDNKYLKGNISKGYGFTETMLLSEFERYEMTDIRFHRKVKRDILNALNERRQPEVKAMRKWYGGLQMDINRAEKINKTQRASRYKELYNKMIIEDYQDAFEGLPIRDMDSTFRVYSKITMSPRILRDTISYKGEELVQIDLRASQIYFTCFLLDPANWTMAMIRRKPYAKIWEGLRLPMSKIKTGKALMKEILRDKVLVENIEMFKRDLLTDIYSVVGDHLALRNPAYAKLDRPARRKKVKERLLKSIFDNTNKKKHVQSGSEWTTFCEIYPAVGKLYTFIKSAHYADLSWILQRIESTVMVDFVMKQILKELPATPVFLLHDCIVTTRKYSKKVEQVMQRVIGDVIGFPPITTTEDWTKPAARSHSTAA